ncbi:hypothetical protein [Streptomyces atratus]|uniref:hypothetical protein n=1 Tax=Streptomyces atratus TaxID=1893 RepID=UPI00225BC140|nr:hypothetical protein [Streptomyces atratus]MCX5345763.1 hypothetical protein [Streptomyces atratus]MCX5345919.1 hypothetical protein [Streptomyces atratus]MCX5346063.1 hypothetical protein [Streptomyces atratus]
MASTVPHSRTDGIAIFQNELQENDLLEVVFSRFFIPWIAFRLADGSSDPRVRIAACLVLLFAQPVSRIVHLTIDDVLRDDAQLLLKAR